MHRVPGVSGVTGLPALARRALSRAADCWRIVLLAPLLALHGCSDVSRDSVSLVKLALHRQPPIAPTAAEVAAKPYAQMLATGPDGAAVLVLGNIDGTRLAWYSRDSAVLFLEHGRVVQTTGLRQDLDGLQLPAANPFARGLQTVTAPLDYTLRMDWSPGYRYGVIVHAHPGRAGSVDPRQRAPALRFDEDLGAGADCHAQSLLGRTSRWLRLEKRTVRGTGPALELVQLRPYRGSS